MIMPCRNDIRCRACILPTIPTPERNIFTVKILKQLNPKPYAPACTFRTGALTELAIHAATKELYQQEH